MQRRQFLMNLLQEIDVDRAIASGLYLRPGATYAQVESFVGSDVNEGRRELLGDLRKPVFDEGQRARLAGSQHVTMWRFGDILVKVVLQNMVKMAECLLLGHHRDVILAGVADQFFYIGGSERAACGRRQRLVGKQQSVLDVGRIDIDLVGSEDTDLVLLKLERGKGTAR